mmetsp:Transcript_42657/g.78866  ORF Transcript_42657/g.78866 Transcript_42657/m.78866 type:complete len:422 (-) Transcript_42657:1795-3060(-)
MVHHRNHLHVPRPRHRVRRVLRPRPGGDELRASPQPLHGRRGRDPHGRRRLRAGALHLPDRNLPGERDRHRHHRRFRRVQRPVRHRVLLPPLARGSEAHVVAIVPRLVLLRRGPRRARHLRGREHARPGRSLGVHRPVRPVHRLRPSHVFQPQALQNAHREGAVGHRRRRGGGRRRRRSRGEASGGRHGGHRARGGERERNRRDERERRRFRRRQSGGGAPPGQPRGRRRRNGRGVPGIDALGVRRVRGGPRRPRGRRLSLAGHLPRRRAEAAARSALVARDGRGGHRRQDGRGRRSRVQDHRRERRRRDRPGGAGEAVLAPGLPHQPRGDGRRLPRARHGRKRTNKRAGICCLVRAFRGADQVQGEGDVRHLRRGQLRHHRPRRGPKPSRKARAARHGTGCGRRPRGHAQGGSQGPSLLR